MKKNNICPNFMKKYKLKKFDDIIKANPKECCYLTKRFYETIKIDLGQKYWSNLSRSDCKNVFINGWTLSLGWVDEQ